MKIKDIHEGDILLFRYDHESNLSRTIRILTGGSVSHAAIYCNTKDYRIIESVTAGVGYENMYNICDRRYNAFVRRLKNKTLPKKPIRTVAEKYASSKTPYTKIGSYTFAILLIYSRFAKESAYKPLVVEAVKFLSRLLVAHRHVNENPGKLPMTCSQFVAQCFADAGPAYSLFPDSVFMNYPESPSQIVQAACEMDAGYLANCVQDSVADVLAEPFMPAEQIEWEMDNLAGDFIALAQTESPVFTAVGNVNDFDLAVSFAQWAGVLQETMPCEAAAGEDWTQKTLQILEAFEQTRYLFISPKDLLEEEEKLETIGLFRPQ